MVAADFQPQVADFQGQIFRGESLAWLDVGGGGAGRGMMWHAVA
jgi:hypothetical protein